MRPAWWLDLPTIPEGYHRLLAPRLNAPWVPELLARCPVAPGERVLDLACGAGLVAAAAADAGARVEGADSWDEMARIARRERPGLGWVLADLGRLPFRAGAFDVALCQQGLQFADEASAALQEARRVLRPGGRLGATVWADLGGCPAFAALRDAVGARLGMETAPGVAVPEELADPEAFAATLAEAGFGSVRVERVRRILRFGSVEDFLRSFVAGSYLSEHVSAASPRQLAGILDDMEKRLAPRADAGGFAFPIEAHVAVARAP